jgi:hypothetical protein
MGCGSGIAEELLARREVPFPRGTLGFVLATVQVVPRRPLTC